MAGLGGLLSGLGGKLGGAFQGAARGAQDALFGNPTFAATSNDLEPGLLDAEGLKRPPTLTPTGNTEGGLLSNFLNTDESGISGRDRMFALGSILQGDSGGAQSYLSGQAAQAQAMRDRQRREELERAGMEALSGSIDDRGNFDMRQYMTKVRQLGIDPSSGLQMAQSLAPKVSTMTPGAGGLIEVTQGPFGGPSTTRTLVEGKPNIPDAPTGQRWNAAKGAFEVDPVALDWWRQTHPQKPVSAGRGGGGRAGGKAKAAIPPPGDGYVVQTR